MEFNILRFWNLCKRDFFINLRADIIMLSIMGILGGLFFITNHNFSGLLFSYMIAFLGFRVFTEYSRKLSRSQILLLPVSNLERFINVFIRGFIFYPICVVIALLLGVFVIASFLSILRTQFDFINIMNDSLSIFKDLFHIIVKYYSVYIIFFFGSIFYKRYAGFKMGLLMFGIAMFMGIIVGIIFLIMGFNYGWNNGFNNLSMPTYIENIIDIITLLFFIGLSYLRLTEEQA